MTVTLTRADFERMAQLAPMLEAAIERGELLPCVDREELFSFAAGAIFRMFIASRNVDNDFIRTVANTYGLYCSPSAAAKLSLPARIA